MAGSRSALNRSELRLVHLLRVFAFLFLGAAILYGSGPFLDELGALVLWVPLLGASSAGQWVVASLTDVSSVFVQLPLVAASVVKVSLLGWLCLYAAADMRRRHKLVALVIAAHVVSVSAMLLLLLTGRAASSASGDAVVGVFSSVPVATALWSAVGLDGVILIVLIVMYRTTEFEAPERSVYDLDDHLPSTPGECNLKAFARVSGWGLIAAAAGVEWLALAETWPALLVELPFVTNTVVALATVGLVCLFVVRETRQRMSLMGLVVWAQAMGVGVLLMYWALGQHDGTIVDVGAVRLATSDLLLLSIAAAGVFGRLVVIKGNHDLELHWTLVQKAVRHFISPAAPVAWIQFEEESWQEGNVYVEHGHRWEAMTAVHTRTAWLPHRPDEISLPLGSFVNRYLINGIERLDPFIDNVKPVNAALRELLRKYPLTILTLWTRGIRFLWRIPRVKGFFCSLSSAFQVLILIVAPPVLVVGATILLGQRLFPGLVRYSFLDWPIRLVGGGLIGGVSIQILLPLAVSLVRDLKRLLGFRSQDALQEAAERLSPVVFPDLPQVPVYIVMGHTHHQQMTALNTTAAFYANCGTWVPIWPSDRIDLAGRVFLSFVEFTWEPDLSAYIGETKRWNDEAGTAQPAKLFEGLDMQARALVERRGA